MGIYRLSLEVDLYIGADIQTAEIEFEYAARSSLSTDDQIKEAIEAAEHQYPGCRVVRIVLVERRDLA